MIKYTLIVVAAIAAGWFAREYTTSNTVSRAVHSIENTAETVQTDHVALERHLARRERRDEMMFELFDRVMTIIENDVDQRKVAIDTPRDDNKEQ
jgi:hypothetical protein